MRIFWNEWYKVAGRRSFRIAWLAFLLANGILIWTSGSGNQYRKSDYKSVFDSMEEMSFQEAKSFMEEKYHELTALREEEITATYGDLDRTDFYAQYELVEQLYEEIQRIDQYPDYLQDIQKKAEFGESISIFQSQDAFSIRNAKKTAQAFQGLENLELDLNRSSMIEQTTGFQGTDLFLVLLVFWVCSLLAAEEKGSDLFSLLRPLKLGRSRLMTGKLCVCLVSVACLCLTFLVENFVISGYQYGFARLDLPLQTISEYSGSALHESVGQYLALYYVSKVLALYLLGLWFFLFALFSRTIPLYYGKVLVFLALSYVLYAVIPGNSMAQILKYVNAIFFIRVSPVYRYYFSLNIVGIPLDMPTVFWGTSLILAAILSGLLLFRFSNQEVTAFERRGKHKRQKTGIGMHTNLLLHEGRKILITNGAGLVLALFAAFQFYSVSQRSAYLSYEEYYYREYMLALEGGTREQTQEMIEKESQRYEQLDELWEEAYLKWEEGEINDRELAQTQDLISEQTKGRNAFARVLERVEYVMDYEKQHGEALELVYEGGWNYLFGREEPPYKTDMLRAVALVLMMIVALSGVFPMEYSTHMINLMTCYKRGRMDTVKRKGFLCLGISTCLYLLNYIPELLYASRIYGLHEWGACIYSIPTLAEFPIGLSIGGYAALLFGIRYLMMLSVLSLLLAISLYGKSIVNTMLSLLFILAAPLLLELLGVKSIRYMSLNLFLTGNGYLDGVQQNPFAALALFIPISIGLMGIHVIRKKFQE